MTDSFGIESTPEDSALVASKWTSGGNSYAARRARVALQRRDKYGRWAEMGGGVSFPGRDANGNVTNVIGRYIGPAERDGYMRVEVTDPKSGVKLGVYEVPGKVATVSKAILTGEQLSDAGIKLDVNGNRIGKTLDKDIENFADMFKGAKPDAVEKGLIDQPLNTEEKAVVEKARLNAPAHISYNVVDENGNPLPADQIKTGAPEKPKAELKPEDNAPEGPYDSRPSENMTLWMNNKGELHPLSVVREPGTNNWKIIRSGDINDVYLGGFTNRENAEAAANAKINKIVQPKAEIKPQSVSPSQQPSATTDVVGQSLKTNEASIDRSQLNAKELEALDNLVAYKNKALDALKMSAAANDAERFNRQYAIAQRVSEVINQFAKKAETGDQGSMFFFSGAEAPRSENIRILPDSIKVNPNHQPGQNNYILEAQAVLIAKDGRPFLMNFTASQNGLGGYINGFTIEEDGRPGRSVSSLTWNGTAGDREPHKLQPITFGCISTNENYQNTGLAGFMMTMGRWAYGQEPSPDGKGRIFSHSSTLLMPGNFYSKLVTRQIEAHHRTQRAKAVFERQRNAPIFKALDALGMISNTWKRPLGCEQNHQHGPNCKSVQGGESNRDPLYPIFQEVKQLADRYRARFHNDNNAVAGQDYPAIFEDHVKGAQEDWSKWDIQMNLLRSSYKQGPTKAYLLDMLKDIQNGAEKERLTGLATTMSRLHSAIEAVDFRQEDLVDEPKPFDASAVRMWDSPFAGQENFTAWTLPDGMKKLDTSPAFTPNRLAPEGGASLYDGWTEDPIELAQKFSTEDLISALRDAIVNKKDGIRGTLKFSGKDGSVRNAAIVKALQQKGEDSANILAGIYDEALGAGRTDNRDALVAKRAGMTDIRDAIDKFRAQIGELDKPIAFSKIGGNWDSVNEVLSGDLKRRDEIDPSNDPNLAFSEINPDLQAFQLPDGRILSDDPYQPQVDPAMWLIAGTTDSPRIIARNFSTAGLKAALENNLRTGNQIKLKFPGDSERLISPSAIRDALELQGVDTNQMIRDLNINASVAPRSPRTVAQEVVGDLNIDRTVFNRRELVPGRRFMEARYKGSNETFQYDLALPINVGDDNGAFKIAKVRYDASNPDAPYAVWFAREGDQKVDEWGAEPNARFADQNMAMGAVRQAVVEDMALTQAPRSLSVYRAPNKAFDEVSISPAELGSDVVSAKAFKIGTLLNKHTVIAKEMGSASPFAYSFVKRDANGDITELANVEKTPDGNFLAKLDGTTQRVFTTKEKAAQWLGAILGQKQEVRNSILNGKEISTELADVNKIDADSSTLLESKPGTNNAELTEKVSKVVLGNGEVITFSATVKKGQHPGYRRNQPDYVYAEISGKRGGEESASFTAKVAQTGRMRWSVSFKDNMGRQVYGGTYDNKSKALDALRAKMKESYGIKEEHNLIPNVPVVDRQQAKEERERQALERAQREAQERAAAREAQRIADEKRRAQNPDEPQTVQPMDNQEIADIIAERAVPVDATSANVATVNNGGGGVTGSKKVVLNNGEVYKVKIVKGGMFGGAPMSDHDQAKRILDNEIFVHALFQATGANASKPRAATSTENGADVPALADPWLPNVNRLQWDEIFSSNKKNDPQYDQARKDCQNMMMALLLSGHQDIIGHGGNIVLHTDENGVIRASMIDGGGGCAYAACPPHPERTGFFNPNDNGQGFRGGNLNEYIRKLFGPSFLSTGAVVTPNGFKVSGLRKADVVDMARQQILPLTPDKIRQLANGIYRDQQIAAKVADTLIDRRAKILDLMGINDAPIPAQGIEVPKAPAQAIQRVDMNQHLPSGMKLRGDGVYVPNDPAELPTEIKMGILRGEIIPEQRPFAFKPFQEDPNRTPPTYVDKNGDVHQSPFGARSVFLRFKGADGKYRYIMTAERANAVHRGRWMPTGYAPNMKKNDQVDAGLLAEDGFNGGQDMVNGGTVVLKDVVNVSADDKWSHKIAVVDVGSQDIGRLTSKDHISDHRVMTLDEIQQAMSEGNFFGEFGQKNQNLLDSLRRAENAPNQPKVDAVAQANNAVEDGDNVVEGHHHEALMPDRRAMLVRYIKRQNGSQELIIGQENMGHVRPYPGGKFMIQFMPDHIGTVKNGRNNGDALMAVFDNEIDAKRFLSDLVSRRIGAVTSKNWMDPNAPEIAPGEVVRPNHIVEKGYLNPAISQRQLDLANRLISHKTGTPEERKEARAILNRQGVTVGEVGNIINQFKDRGDRPSDEVTRENAPEVPGEPKVPSDLNNQGPVDNGGGKRVSSLKAGDGIRVSPDRLDRVVFVQEIPDQPGKFNMLVINGQNGQLVPHTGVSGDEMVPHEKIEVPSADNAKGNPVQNFRARGNHIIEQVKAAYPAHQQLPNGDLVIAQRDYQELTGGRRNLRYEVVVHRKPNEEFVAYAREVVLDGNGNIVGTPRSAALTDPAHSPLALLNRIQNSELISGAGPETGILGRRPNNWFNNQGDKGLEAINPATGQHLPPALIPNHNANYIGDTGIEATGNPIKDALISHIADQIDRRMDTAELMRQLTGPLQNLYSRHQIEDIVERIQANRKFPGVNQIPYVSRDNKTIVRVGDRVRHLDAEGNVLKEGVVVARRERVLNRKPQGDYEYTDKLYVVFPGRRQQTEIAARRLEVISRADGSPAVPAVQNTPGANPPAAPSAPAAPPAPSAPEAPAEPSAPAAPSAPVNNGAPAFTDPRVKDGKLEISGIGYPAEQRDIVPMPQAGAVLKQFPARSIGGDYNPGYYWLNPDGTVALWNRARDGKSHTNAMPPAWNQPDNSGVKYRPGDKFDPNYVPTPQATDVSKMFEEPKPPTIVPLAPAPTDVSAPRPNPSVLRDGERLSDPADVSGINKVTENVIGVRTTYNVNRAENETNFVANDGRMSFTSVQDSGDGKWNVVDARGRGDGIIGTYNSREEAEMHAMNRIASNVEPPQEPNAPATPEAPAVPEAPAQPQEFFSAEQLNSMKRSALSQLEDLENRYPDAQGEPLVTEVDPLDGQTKTLPKSEFLRRRIRQLNQRLENINAGQQAPSPETPQAPPAFNVDVNGKAFTSRASGNRLTFYSPDGNEAGSLVRNADGTIDYLDPFSGEIVRMDNFAGAVSHINQQIKLHDDAGLIDGTATPEASSPATPEAPQAPSAPNAGGLPAGFDEIPAPREDAPTIFKHATDPLNNPYASIKRGTDENGNPVWQGKMYAKGDDMMNGVDPAETRSFASEQEARDWASRKLGNAVEIGQNSEEMARNNPANFLENQTGNDGIPYIGAKGVPGKSDGELPIYGITPLPFGQGWAVAGWAQKDFRDGGMPPASFTQFRTEEEAKQHAQQQMSDAIQQILQNNQ